MAKRILGSLLVLCCAVTLLQQPAWAQTNPLWISCEGIESTGGGTSSYQYTLMNTGSTPVTLTRFYVGTMDLNPANYTAWVSPPGFVPSVVAPGPPFSVMFTDQTKTPHGAFMPNTPVAAPGVVVWQFGSLILNPTQQVTFGFNHPSASWDMEWFAEHPAPPNTSQGFVPPPIAGPIGVFTQGYVHGPSIEPVSVAPTTFGRIKTLYR